MPEQLRYSHLSWEYLAYKFAGECETMFHFMHQKMSSGYCLQCTYKYVHCMWIFFLFLSQRIFIAIEFLQRVEFAIGKEEAGRETHIQIAFNMRLWKKFVIPTSWATWVHKPYQYNWWVHENWFLYLVFGSNIWMQGFHTLHIQYNHLFWSVNHFNRCTAHQ